jgi:F-type H+-transporting ATPase subunit c
MNKVFQYLKWSMAAFILPVAAFAEEAAHTAGGAGAAGAAAVGFGLALAVIAAATAQGRIATAFMDGVSRNPGATNQMKTPLLLSLIFVETLVLFTVLICFMLMNKI